MNIESITGASGVAYAENVSSALKNEAKAQPENGIMDLTSIRVEKQTKAENDENKDNKDNKEGLASEKQIKNAVSQANQKIKHAEGTKLEFSYHEATKRVSIQVIDKDTKEIIREIPPEKSLDMLQKMWELAGILVDERR